PPSRAKRETAEEDPLPTAKRGCPTAAARRRLDYRALDLFRATAAAMSPLNAFSSNSSSSWRSMARLTLPSRLELNRPEGSSSAAPLAKVSFTTLLYVSPVQMIPSCSHTGTPLHFHASTTPG